MAPEDQFSLSPDKGIPISCDRVRNTMHCMGLRAIYQKPRTTIAGDPAKRFPCLVDLKLVTVDLKLVTAMDQAWATDIIHMTLRKGFL